MYDVRVHGPTVASMATMDSPNPCCRTVRLGTDRDDRIPLQRDTGATYPRWATLKMRASADVRAPRGCPAVTA